jgi:hypothetical protein
MMDVIFIIIGLILACGMITAAGSLCGILCTEETTQGLDDNRMPPETTNVAAIYNAPPAAAQPTTNAPGRLVSLV